MAFVAQFFVCRVVVANYYWSLMISAVTSLDTKPVRPLSCHCVENGKMQMYHVSPVSRLLHSGLSVRVTVRSCKLMLPVHIVTLAMTILCNAAF